MRPSRLALIAAGALTIAAGCLNDRTVAPSGTEGALALKVRAPRRPVAAPSEVIQTVEVRVYFFPFGDSKANGRIAREVSQVDLYDHSIRTDSGSHRVAATFPLTGCLPYFTPDEAGAYCQVYMQLTLRLDSQIVDRQYVGNLRVRPGQITYADSVSLGFQSVPPVTTASSHGVRVYQNLVRYNLVGSDVNGDITGADASVMDSSSAFAGSTIQFFSQPVASVGGSLTDQSFYAYVDPSARAANYTASLRDATGQLSENGAGAPIDPPDAQNSPSVFAVQSTPTVDSIAFTASYFAGISPLLTMDFVVQTYVGATITEDTVYQVCTVFARDQSGTISGACARRSGILNAHVTAVPMDAAGRWGFAYDCDLGASCNNSVIVHDRRRRP